MALSDALQWVLTTAPVLGLITTVLPLIIGRGWEVTKRNSTWPVFGSITTEVILFAFIVGAGCTLAV